MDMPDIKSAATRKIGPLPAYAWGLVIGGGVLVGRKLMGGRGGSSQLGTGAVLSPLDGSDGAHDATPTTPATPAEPSPIPDPWSVLPTPTDPFPWGTTPVPPLAPVPGNPGGHGHITDPVPTPAPTPTPTPKPTPGPKPTPDPWTIVPITGTVHTSSTPPTISHENIPSPIVRGSVATAQTAKNVATKIVAKTVTGTAQQAIGAAKTATTVVKVTSGPKTPAKQATNTAVKVNNAAKNVAKTVAQTRAKTAITQAKKGLDVASKIVKRVPAKPKPKTSVPTTKPVATSSRSRAI